MINVLYALISKVMMTKFLELGSIVILQKKCCLFRNEQNKESSQNNPKESTAVFDLQQVIYITISKKDKVFYKSQLTN